MRSYGRLIGLGVALVVLVAVGGLLAWFLLRSFFRPNFDRDGGTILVYEIDAEELPPGCTPEELAAAMQRRVDPADLGFATVRPQDSRRMEVRIPRTRGEHQARVEDIKDLLARTGRLEFRILANERDDPAGIQSARDFFTEAKNNQSLKDDLELRALTGKPPPSRRPQDPTTFPTTLPGTPSYSYSWVELDRDERYTLGLDNAAENEPERKDRWMQAAEARKRGETLTLPGGLLLYSRRYEVPQPAAKDADKKYEYFLLTRDPEPGKAVTGEYLASVDADVDEKRRPAVKFRFDTQGGNLFYDLTNLNKPSDGFRRHLAIVVDGMIVSAPTLNEAIRSSGQISGISSREDVDTLVRILRGGALPVPLKPRPLSRTEVAPKSAR